MTAVLPPMAPPTGRIEGREFLFSIRVYYEDTDAGGIVYHANYLRYAERARSEFLRALDWPHDRLMREAQAVWVVRRAVIDFRAAAHFDDALLVTSAVTSVSGVRVGARQEVTRDGLLLAGLDLELALVRDGRPVRLPAGLGTTLRALVPPSLPPMTESSQDP